jgi:hypothetical protein
MIRSGRFRRLRHGSEIFKRLCLNDHYFLCLYDSVISCRSNQPRFAFVCGLCCKKRRGAGL